MANRTGTYIAFDGLGITDPTKNDYKYFATIKAWNATEKIDFRFTDSHAKTDAVRDTSLRATLEARIRQRLGASKNMVVVLSDKTRKSGSVLSYEIEKAVDLYDLPLICAYAGYRSIFKPRELSARWPNVLTNRIDNGTAKAIHIPFMAKPLFDAIGQFTVGAGNLDSGVQFYSVAAHKEFGCID